MEGTGAGDREQGAGGREQGAELVTDSNILSHLGRIELEGILSDRK